MKRLRTNQKVASIAYNKAKYRLGLAWEQLMKANFELGKRYFDKKR